MTVTAVIPLYNGRPLLAKLLASLASQTRPFDRILVVDNGSTDGAPDLARAQGCTVLPLGHNMGFAAAVNHGWQAASSDWIAILNSDVELSPTWLQTCLNAKGNAAFLTGKLLQTSNPALLDGTYDLLSRAGCAWRAGNGQPDSPTQITPITLAPATACLYRRSVLVQLQGFDESFGSYLEDVDLGLRAARAGFSGLYVPAAIATHVGSATFGSWNPRVVRLISRNQLLLIARHYDRRLARKWFWPILTGQLLWGALALRHGTALAWLQGKRDGLRQFHWSTQPSHDIQRVIEASEAEIRRRASDFYWDCYFGLNGVL